LSSAIVCSPDAAHADLPTAALRSAFIIPHHSDQQTITQYPFPVCRQRVESSACILETRYMEPLIAELNHGNLSSCLDNIHSQMFYMPMILQ